MADRLSKLLESYESHIDIQWNSALSAEERAVIVVYDKSDELKLRARLGEFELVTKNSQHGWLQYDLTDAFPNWMMSQKRVTPYFNRPNLLKTKYQYFFEDLVEQIVTKVQDEHSQNDVLCLFGCGALFGFISISDLLKAVSKRLDGRVVLFFPGEKIDNVFRLLDATDGWGYQATTITN
ncbi:DUF1788 domain-containing protein [Vibrio cholerae]|nr:DUF1788 domain-containing protein [Vibrio parahaemolyticus]EJG1995255.1 DUF1788 domain-containing protein [Vibrio parahaemolyticus]EJL6578345.1 DUF1788 domain-containing protein [Vibrio cholerae]HBK7267020.1 DUF1788 domain-containing protein [Vibrio cholerae]HDL9430939.1 DUF1788 domain-containing protein [Vibrio cholerae]